MNELIIVGGGEHARAVIDAARSRPGQWSVVGFIDDAPCDEIVRLGVRRLGSDADAQRLLGPDRLLALGVGSVSTSSVRPQIIERYRALADRWAIVIHRHAWVSPTAIVQPGCVVMAGAIVNGEAELGAHCVINTGAIVEHDCRVGAFVQLGPGAILGGGCTVGAGSFLGLGSKIRDHVHIGSNTMVAMGAVVTASVGDGQLVMGIPARAVPSHG